MHVYLLFVFIYNLCFIFLTTNCAFNCAKSYFVANGKHYDLCTEFLMLMYLSLWFMLPSEINRNHKTLLMLEHEASISTVSTNSVILPLGF